MGSARQSELANGESKKKQGAAGRLQVVGYREPEPAAGFVVAGIGGYCCYVRLFFRKDESPVGEFARVGWSVGSRTGVRGIFCADGDRRVAVAPGVEADGDNFADADGS